MSARATIKAGDLNRLLKAAKAHGFAVEFCGETVRLSPVNESAPPSPPDSEDGEAAWDKALGLQ